MRWSTNVLYALIYRDDDGVIPAKDVQTVLFNTTCIRYMAQELLVFVVLSVFANPNTTIVGIRIGFKHIEQSLNQLQ